MSSQIEIIKTSNAPPAVQGVYSQATKANGMIFCSGQIPMNAAGEMVEGDIQVHTRQCINNLKAVLESAGSSLEKIVKVNVFLASMDDFAKMNEIYSEMFAEPKPARSCVAVKTLPKNVDVEIECIALA